MKVVVEVGVLTTLLVEVVIEVVVLMSVGGDGDPRILFYSQLQRPVLRMQDSHKSSNFFRTSVKARLPILV